MDIDNNMLGSATVITSDGKRLMLHGENLPIIPNNSLIKAIGYSKDGMLIMEGVISLSMGKQMNLDINESEMRTDRREFFKVKTNEQAIVLFGIMPNKKHGLSYNERITLRDLSLGGLCFYSNKTYFKNQVLHIELPAVQIGFRPKVKLLRKVREAHKIGYKYRYAGRFIEADATVQRILLEHIFKLELLNHKATEEE